MRRALAFIAVVLFMASAATAFAKVDPRDTLQNAMRAPMLGTPVDDIPARAPDGYAREDTIDFGYFQVIGGTYYAVQGGMWTFDHGSSVPWEGFSTIDLSTQPGAYFRYITTAIWTADPNNPTPAPIIAGTGSLWVGLFENEARALCWDAGLGYGNIWCQRATSPILNYDGSGNVDLAMKFWTDSEQDFDYSYIYLQLGSDRTQLGAFTGVNGSYSAPLNYSHAISNTEFGGGTTARDFRIVFEFVSDSGWSDEDALWPTTYGPFGADDVTLQNNLTGGNAAYNFDSGLQGWTPAACPGAGSFFGIADISNYVLDYPCECNLEGNVAKFHDAGYEHPVGQKEMAVSPIANRSNLQGYGTIMAYWDMYADLPLTNGVLYRAGWDYYPFICPNTGQTMWSGRQGISTWYYAGDAPECYLTRNVGTDYGVPASCTLIKFCYEVYSSCDAFGVDPCSGVTNFSPIIDNIQIRMTGTPGRPPIRFLDGTLFQDGFGQGLVLSTTDPGNADITYDLHRDQPLPDLLGDSLSVFGPSVISSTKWLSKLWFRIRREGPRASLIPGYTTWKTRVADGLNIVGANGQFTYGWMDSLETATAWKNWFVSQFHENDDDFVAPDQGEGNEIIPDHLLAPGTQIEYFCTSAYTCTPTYYFYLPDTTGKFYREFEILPSYRTVSGVDKFPCVLWIDAYNRGSQNFVEDAMNVVLNGAPTGAPIPNPTTWDRYDYWDSSSNWEAPMFRNVGGNSGASLPQLLGYRMIILNTGDLGKACMDPRDWAGFADWLTAGECGANASMQSFYANGDNISQNIANLWPSLLSTLGAAATCDTYNSLGCPSGETEAMNDQQSCTRLDGVNGGPWQPGVALDVFGNWCPQRYSFDVLGTAGSGFGNKKYHKVDTATTVNYAQVTNDKSNDPQSNYRTVIDGYSFHHLIKRDLNNLGPETECVVDTTRIVEGVYNEIREAIKWTLNLSNPTVLAGLCENPCTSPSVEDGATQTVSGVNRLIGNYPNPFNPRTTIKFALATAGPAKLVIFDVNGRKVKTLVDGQTASGQHEIVWDGTDDSGRIVGSGVFWSQLTVGDYASSRKMVVLK